MTDMAFGGALKRLRRVAGLTQEELAERTGYSAGYVGMLERGVRIPPVEAVSLLAHALGIDAPERELLEQAAERDRRSALASTEAGADRRPLPGPYTALHGREGDMARINRLLQERGVRLLTLTGPAGVGKTRLALEIGRVLGPRYRDGLVVVELAPVSTPQSVIHALTEALGLRDTTSRPVEESLLQHCRDRQYLLVLDNFEHVLPAAPLLSRLLAAAPRMQLLVTSRAPLRLTAEQEYAVPPLSVPAPDVHDSPSELLQSPSVQLFVERARAVRLDLPIDDEDTRAIATICRRLDGLPLAIELAAVRVRLFTPRELLARLAASPSPALHSLRLLSGGAKDLPPRLQTLTAAIDWSYDLLSEAQRRVFDRLAVFAGGWTLEAATAVSADDESIEDFVDDLAQLVDQSLVIVDLQPGGTARYRMLEPIRQYAMHHLVENGELDHMRGRHARFYVQLAETADPELAGPNQGVWLDRLQRETDNMRAALVWAGSGTGDPELGLRLAARFARLLLHRGNLGEARSWIEQMLALAPHADPATRALAFQRAGVLCWNLGDLDAAQLNYQRALEGFRALGNESRVAWTLAYLGELHRARLEHEASSRVTEESLALARRLDDRRLLAVCLAGLADIAELDGELHRAEDLREESLTMYREIGHHLLVGITSHQLAVLARRQGNHERALALHAESLDIFISLQNRAMISAALGGFAAVAQELGQYERAVCLMAAANVLRQESSFGVRPIDEEDSERRLRDLSTALGEVRFTQAWNTGGAMTQRDAIAYALDWHHVASES